MRLLFMVFFIFLNLLFATKSNTKTQQTQINCILNADYNACVALIDSGLPNVYECNAENECGVIGIILHHAKREKEALPYFKKIQEISDLKNYNSNGIFYKQKKDYVNAKKQFESGCFKHYAPSCLELGKLYDNGQGVKRNYTKALEYYAQACNGKIASGCHHIGTLYYNGQGIAYDLVQANEYFQKACDMNYQDACHLLQKTQSQGKSKERKK